MIMTLLDTATECAKEVACNAEWRDPCNMR